MQAIVLVGGEGTRLRPLTFGTPKPMVPIMNVPFLALTLERLSAVGIKDIILPAGYMPQAITEYFGDGSRLGVKITYVIEDEPLGTAGAIKNVEQYITGPFFVLNGDVLTSLDLEAMMRFHAEKGGLGVLHLIKAEDPSAFGCVVNGPDGRVRQFVEKPAKGTEPTNEVNAGTYLLERRVLDFIPGARNVSIERETFPKILASGEALYAYTTSDYWIDLGRPEHYLSAHRAVLDGSMPLVLASGISGPGADGADSATIVAPVYLDHAVVLDPSATIGPHVVLGKGCRVGPGAVVRDSVLWDDVVVEEGALVEKAIVASRTRIGKHAKIGIGSVIGHDVDIPDGTVAEMGSRIGASGAVSVSGK